MTYTQAKAFSDRKHGLTEDLRLCQKMVDVSDIWCEHHGIDRATLDNSFKIDFIVTQPDRATRYWFVQERNRRDTFDTITIRDSEWFVLTGLARDAGRGRHKVVISTYWWVGDTLRQWVMFDITGWVKTKTEEELEEIRKKYLIINHQRKHDSAFTAIPFDEVNEFITYYETE